MRDEAGIISDLENLCTSSGYCHILAYICFKEGVILYVDELTDNDLQKFNSNDRLIRTEISTLIGLMIKEEINQELPTLDRAQEMFDQTYTLFHELHQAMNEPFYKNFEDSISQDFNLFKKGALLREPIFYASESAYNFQYRHLAPKKYKFDSDWLARNKGFTTSEAADIIRAITKIQNDKSGSFGEYLGGLEQHEWTLLPVFSFTINEVVDKCDESEQTIKNVIKAFSVPKGKSNENFEALNDFNLINAYPIIPLKEDRYLLLDQYKLEEAFYETPYYWMLSDKEYKDEALENRGNFTEDFSASCLRRVFFKENIFKNVDIVDSAGNKAGEIDVLVIYDGRAIIVQAKSKRLTIKARKGNDKVLKDDFQKSVQNSYKQGFSCAELIEDTDYKLVDNNGNELKINRKYKEIYIFSVLSDHYPALSFQTNQFLEYQRTTNILPPFVADIFCLDVVCEILDSPLFFLSYINRRVEYDERIISNNELAILGYHLKTNLWIDEEVTLMHFEDDLATEIDRAMTVRRELIEGNPKPEGILTRYRNTNFGKLIEKIESLEHQQIVDLGFFLLKLDGDTIEQINNGIDHITRLTRSDNEIHDFSLGIGNSGLTVHCNSNNMQSAAKRLDAHCGLRKYSTKVESWYGLCIAPDKSIRFGVNLEYPWQWSIQKEKILKGLPKGKKETDLNKFFKKRKKVGRNAPCPCESGKKYKYCCLNKK